MKTRSFLHKLSRSDTALSVFIPIAFFGVVIGSVYWLITPHPKHVHLAQQSAIEAPLPTPEQHLHSQPVRIESGDHLSKIFQRLKIPPQTLVELMRIDTFKNHASSLYPGHALTITQDDKDALVSLDYAIQPNQTLHVERKAEGQWSVGIEEEPLSKEVAFAHLTIHNSLDRAISQQKLSRKISQQLIDIYGDRINLNKHLQPGDSFTIMYERKKLNDQVIGTGSILSAECKHRKKTIYAIRYKDNQGRVGYYDLKGQSLQKAYLRYPCRFRRVSSKFNLHRMHPILGKRRPHYGVDLAARTGTPIHAIADGKVLMAKYNGGYGRMIKLQHSTRRSTVYGHLSRFAKGLRKGQHVVKGQVIGYVGSTGFATGPHLHFEVLVNNQHVNPLTTPLPAGKSLSEKQIQDYQNKAQAALDEMKQWADTHNDNNKA